MSNLSRGERLQIMLSPEELSAVDDFRFKQRMPKFGPLRCASCFVSGLQARDLLSR